MSGWTPGPWTAQNTSLDDPWNDTAWVTTPGGRRLAAELSPDDARLIAAAPEMAALLQLWANDSDAYPGTPGLDEATNALLARISTLEPPPNEEKED